MLIRSNGLTLVLLLCSLPFTVMEPAVAQSVEDIIEAQKEIKKESNPRNPKKNNIRRMKYCKANCRYCIRILDRHYAEEFERALNQEETKDDEQPPNTTTSIELNTNNPCNKNMIIDPPVSEANLNEENILEKEINQLKLDSFHEKPVNGDGNCLLKSILIAADTPEDHHT